ncbi:uncharacterized protein DAT39_008928 [Clarias magur]|uniref:Uncharacterized protein n=1 Tax=Clarias magur TaxID=1594786 RepID=A0A8J4XE96_CLAMG|nr:uncharacterized protein DAT39_008928 [Clarias magur]
MDDGETERSSKRKKIVEMINRDSITPDVICSSFKLCHKHKSQLSQKGLSVQIFMILGGV